jgi:hypothetical protein
VIVEAERLRREHDTFEPPIFRFLRSSETEPVFAGDRLPFDFSHDMKEEDDVFTGSFGELDGVRSDSGLRVRMCEFGFQHWPKQGDRPPLWFWVPRIGKRVVKIAWKTTCPMRIVAPISLARAAKLGNGIAHSKTYDRNFPGEPDQPIAVERVMARYQLWTRWVFAAWEI